MILNIATQIYGSYGRPTFLTEDKAQTVNKK